MFFALLLQVPLATIPGEVCDLAPDPFGPSGAGFYATTEGEIGRFDPAGQLTQILPAGSFPAALRATYPAPSGDLIVLDELGDLYRLPQATGPATLYYDDLFLVQEPTDLVVDDAGVALLACRTISTGTFAVAHVSPDGQEWAYLDVANQPLALSPDSSGVDYVMSDGQGFLQAFEELHEAPRTTVLTSATGFATATLDGDLAVEEDGDVWFIAGNQLRFLDRSTNITSLALTAPGPLRGVLIAPASSGLGHSVFYSGGAGGSTLWEGPACGPPVPAFTASFGPVPGRGAQRAFSGMNIFDLTTDLTGNLLLAGDLWGAEQAVRRLTIPGFQNSVIAGPADGISGRLEGAAVTPGGQIVAVTSAGVVHTVDEDPLGTVVSTTFNDPNNVIVRAKDLAIGRQGQVWIADWRAYQQGAIQHVDASGQLTTLHANLETRGLAPDPFGAKLLLTEWIGEGFEGRIQSLNVITAQTETLPSMGDLNISNGGVWADGDLLVDARGDTYVACEDEFSVLRHDREHDVKVRVSSGYLNRPAGLALAPASSPGTSATGWSLYVAERNFIWEVDDALPPGPSGLDPFAPAAGTLLGWTRPEHGSPADVIRDPASSDLLAVTDAGYLLRYSLGSVEPASVLRGPADGLPVALSSITATQDGRLAAVSRQGTVLRIDTWAGYAVSTLFTDPQNLVIDAVELVAEPSGDFLLLEADPTVFQGGRIWRLAGTSLSEVADTHHGQAGMLDPTSGELWVLERGRDGEGGEILRVDLSEAPVRAGHARSFPFRTFFGERGSGGLAMNAGGDAFVLEGATGRVWKLDRASGAVLPVGGQYSRPRSATVSVGRSGIAGPGGASLFVLDGPAIYEHGIEGTAPGLLTANLGLPRADLTAPARRVFPGFNSIRVEEPGSAGLTFAILSGFSGKLPGLPLDVNLLFPLNFDSMFQLSGSSVLPDFSGTLDGAGVSPATTGVQLPATIPISSTGLFLDLAWVALDITVPSLIGFRGATAQVYLGL